jgi:hypothetical protein
MDGDKAKPRILTGIWLKDQRVERDGLNLARLAA